MARRSDTPSRRRTRAPKPATEPAADPAPDQSPAPAHGTAAADARRRRRPFAVHLLDVGPEEYGDAVLCQFGDTTVLIDGAHPGDDGTKQTGHPSIPDQLGHLLDQPAPPYRVSLLIVTHAHRDHTGCLPSLVERDLLHADWALVADPDLGWVGPGDINAADAPALRDPRVLELAAAFREETLSPSADEAAVRALLTDARSIEDRYRTMLGLLADRGTTVVRYGTDNPKPLVDRFAGIGFKILGPTRDHLFLCAARIRRDHQDALRLAADLLAADVAADPVALYRRLIAGGLDDPTALDAVHRPGAAINNQSIVARFAYRDHAFLFTGDMQLAVPEVPGLEPHMRAIRAAIRANAPYAFCKLPHHASHNAFDAGILDLLGATPRLGISTGVDSTKHPSPDVLTLLLDSPATIEWARTDRNGRVSLRFEDARPWFDLSRGKLNDPRANAVDVAALPTESRPVEPSQPSTTPAPLHIPATETLAAPTVPLPAPPNVVEVVTKVPHAATRVTVTIDVQPQSGATTAGDVAPPPPQLRPLHVAAGRSLPDLLAVTSRAALAANVGQPAADHVLQALRNAGLDLCDDLPPGVSNAAALEIVRPRLQARPNAVGVLLLGGYDVVPARSIDTLEPPLRAALGAHTDPDDFTVWSDAVYGDRDGDGFAEVAVSRIPDGRSADLLFAAVEAGAAPLAASRGGVRNARRPFADAIFGALPGTGDMLPSLPHTSDTPLAERLAAEHVYLMLHGHHEDCSRFWGEGTADGPEAVHVRNVPPRTGRVVFSGCCWGALVVDTPAGRLPPGTLVGQLAPQTADTSLALRFLAGGATAFIGCTGAHYSPLDHPYAYYGGPLHAAFWRHVAAGVPPAQALFRAKTDYLRGIPHAGRDALARAIEEKTLYQFTCLGLGW